MDVISGTEKAYEIEMKTVVVSGFVESESSYGFLVDVKTNENNVVVHASRREWFPKSHCSYTIERKGTHEVYRLIAPKWMLDKKKIQY